MLTVIPTTKEQLVYYLLNNISLGTYDRRFLDNIEKLNLTTGKAITSNQAELFNKIIRRYSRQLNKNSIKTEEMINLEWTRTPITSLPQYTNAFISIEDNTITIRCPYKKEFINDIRKNHADLPFKWDRDLRIWTVPLSEYTLKISVESIHKHYPSINCCEYTQSILNTIDSYSVAKIWDPTLVKSQNNLYIAAINPSLNDAISHVNLDLELSTLALLQQYGIEIDDPILLELHEKLGGNAEATELLNFVVQRDVTFEITKLDKLADMLAMVKCDFVLMTDSINSRDIGINTQFVDKLKEYNITHAIFDRRNPKKYTSFKNYTLPISINVGLWNKTISNSMSNMVAKTVTLVNSTPIKIK